MDATHTAPLIAPVNDTGSAAVRPDDRARARRRKWSRPTSRPTSRLTESTERAVDDAVARVQRQDGRLTVVVSGELDLDTAPILTAVVDRHLRASAPQALEFELGEVTFMDCSGISALLRYSRRGVDPGCTVTLTHVPTRVRRLVDLTGLTPYFRFDSGDGCREPEPATSSGAAA